MFLWGLSLVVRIDDQSTTSSSIITTKIGIRKRNVRPHSTQVTQHNSTFIAIQFIGISFLFFAPSRLRCRFLLLLPFGCILLLRQLLVALEWIGWLFIYLNRRQRPSREQLRKRVRLVWEDTYPYAQQILINWHTIAFHSNDDSNSVTSIRAKVIGGDVSWVQFNFSLIRPTITIYNKRSAWTYTTSYRVTNWICIYLCL